MMSIGDKIMVRFSLLSFLLFFIAAGCSEVQVNTNFNPKTDFSGLKTYRWLSTEADPGDDLRFNNELVTRTVRAAVENELSAKGFTRDDSGQPDFVVTWFGSIEEKIRTANINHFYSRYGYGALYRDPYWNSQPAASMNAVEYEEGSLVIDFLDPVSHALLWRGSGSGKLKENQSESQVRRNLNGAVTSILADFPPR